MSMEGDYYYSSMKKLRTAKSGDHSLGVLIPGMFTSKLDGREYIEMQVNTLDPWNLPVRFSPVATGEWREAVIDATAKLVEDLGLVIAELTEHRVRLGREIIRLSQELPVSDEEE